VIIRNRKELTGNVPDNIGKVLGDIRNVPVREKCQVVVN
jgi:hypothetical protein